MRILYSTCPCSQKNRFWHHAIHGSLLVCLLSPLAAAALPSDAEKPILMESQTLQYDVNGGKIIYSGDVSMTQGSLSIRADKIIIYGKIDSASRVVATGSPATFQQTAKIGAEPVKARANQLEYNDNDKSLLLTGNASLQQEGTSLSGNTIAYDVKNAIVKADAQVKGSQDKKRVRMVIPPKVINQSQADETPEPANVANQEKTDAIIVQ